MKKSIIRKEVDKNMVFCPVHHKYLNGRNAKINHAYPDNKGWKGCNWMKNYVRNLKDRGKGVLK